VTRFHMLLSPTLPPRALASQGDIRWNFAGIFLFDKDGNPIGRYAAQDLPKIEEALDQAVGA
jgi:glutathione peroxidase-family protein